MKIKFYPKTYLIENEFFFYNDFMGFNLKEINFRLWYHRSFIKEKEGKMYISFPLKNASIKTIKTESGDDIHYITPSKNIIYVVVVHCGYQGNSQITFEDYTRGLLKTMAFWLPSPFKNDDKGVSKGCIIEVEGTQPLNYEWRRSGKTFGEPKSGVTYVYPSGKTDIMYNDKNQCISYYLKQKPTIKTPKN